MKRIILLSLLLHSPAAFAAGQAVPVYRGVAIDQATVDEGKIHLVVRNTTTGYAKFEWPELRLRIRGEPELQTFLGVLLSNGETENLQLKPGQVRHFRMRAAPRGLIEAVLWKDSKEALEVVRLTKPRSPVYVGDIHAKNAVTRRKAAEEKKRQDSGK